ARQRAPHAAAAARRSRRSADRPRTRAPLARLLVARGEFLHLWPQHQRPHRHTPDPRLDGARHPRGHGGELARLDRSAGHHRYHRLRLALGPLGQPLSALLVLRPSGTLATVPPVRVRLGLPRPRRLRDLLWARLGGHGAADCAPGCGHVRPRERRHHVRLDRRVSPTRGSDGRLRWRPVTYLARRLSGDVHERRPALPDRGGSRAPHRPGVAPGAGAGSGGRRSLNRRAGKSLALAAAGVAVVAVPPGALAHPRPLGSGPPHPCAGVPASAASRCVTGVVVSAPPPVIRLTFNEPVQPIGRGIRVVAPSGKRVERGPARASGRSVSVDVDAPEQGTYVVNWRVVSADAQPERGRFTFTVGRPTATVTALPDDRRTVSRSGFVLAVVGRALHFLGYAFGFGSLAFRWLVLRPLAVPQVDTFDRALW